MPSADDAGGSTVEKAAGLVDAAPAHVLGAEAHLPRRARVARIAPPRGIQGLVGASVVTPSAVASLPLVPVV